MPYVIGTDKISLIERSRLEQLKTAFTMILSGIIFFFFRSVHYLFLITAIGLVVLGIIVIIVIFYTRQVDIILEKDQINFYDKKNNEIFQKIKRKELSGVQPNFSYRVKKHNNKEEKELKEIKVTLLLKNEQISVIHLSIYTTNVSEQQELYDQIIQFITISYGIKPLDNYDTVVK